MPNIMAFLKFKAMLILLSGARSAFHSLLPQTNFLITKAENDMYFQFITVLDSRCPTVACLAQILKIYIIFHSIRRVIY